jgi:hypothetical protein
MRVLILAEDCNPQWPSLPVVGFKAARAIADHADVTVATHIRNRENIERVGFGKAKVHYIDNEYIARRLHKFATLIRAKNRTMAPPVAARSATNSPFRSAVTIIKSCTVRAMSSRGGPMFRCSCGAKELWEITVLKPALFAGEGLKYPMTGIIKINPYKLEWERQSLSEFMIIGSA